MINFDDFTKKKNIKKKNPNQPQIPDHPYRTLIITGSGSKNKKLLFNLISHQPSIDKIYLYAKDVYKAKYQLLIDKREGVGIQYFGDSEALLKTQMIWMIFITISKSRIQIKRKTFDRI